MFATRVIQQYERKNSLHTVALLERTFKILAKPGYDVRAPSPEAQTWPPEPSNRAAAARAMGPQAVKVLLQNQHSSNSVQSAVLQLVSCKFFSWIWDPVQWPSEPTNVTGMLQLLLISMELHRTKCPEPGYVYTKRARLPLALHVEMCKQVSCKYDGLKKKKR